MLCNTAIFYDVENIVGVGSKNSSKILEKIHSEIKQLFGEGSIAMQRAYADWGVPQNRSLGKSMLELGILPIQVFNTNPCDKIKNAADVCLIIDAIDVMSTRTEIENFIITSGDGIFSFLAKTLHEHGKTVIGFGLSNSNLIFINACDKFINLQSITTIDKPLSHEESKKSRLKIDEKSKSQVNSVTVTTSKPWVKNIDMGVSKPWVKNIEITTKHAATKNSLLKQPITTIKPTQTNIDTNLPKPPLNDALITQPQQPLKSVNDSKKLINDTIAVKPQQITDNTEIIKAQPPKKPKPPKTFPKIEISKILLDSYLIPLKSNCTAQEALNMAKNLIQVIFEHKTEIELSLFKTYLDYFVGNFKNKKFGFKRFTDYVNFVVKDSPYYLFQKDTVFLIKKKDELLSQIMPPQLNMFQEELYMAWEKERQMLLDVERDKQAENLKNFFEATKSEETNEYKLSDELNQSIKEDSIIEAESVIENELIFEDKPTTENDLDIKVEPVIEDELLEDETVIKDESISKDKSNPEIDSVHTLVNYEYEGNIETSIDDIENLFESIDDSTEPVEIEDIQEIFKTQILSDNQGQSDEFKIIDVQENRLEVSEKQETFLNDSLSEDLKFSKRDIKKALEEIISMNSIPKAEIKRLTKLEYSIKNLGINAPMFKEISKKQDLKSQRLFNDKQSYWSKIFNINDTQYYIYMNWEKKHRDKFYNWIDKFK